MITTRIYYIQHLKSLDYCFWRKSHCIKYTETLFLVYRRWGVRMNESSSRVIVYNKTGTPTVTMPPNYVNILSIHRVRWIVIEIRVIFLKGSINMSTGRVQKSVGYYRGDVHILLSKMWERRNENKRNLLTISRKVVHEYNECVYETKT